MSTGPKLLMFFPGLNVGGIERVMLNLMGAFRERGISLTLLLVRAEGPFLAEVPPDVRVIGVGGGNIYRTLPAVAAVLRRERPDAVLSANPHVNVVASIANRLSGSRARLVISEHNRFLEEDSHSSIRLSVRMRDRLRRAFYPWANGITAVSAGVANSLEAIGLDRSRIRVIYNPIFSDNLLVKAKEPAEHAWLADGGAPVVLAAGRMAPQKDYPTLLRAFAALREQFALPG